MREFLQTQLTDWACILGALFVLALPLTLFVLVIAFVLAWR